MSRLNLGPSAAHRWSVCTASPQFLVDHASDLPPDGGVFADEGTRAHSYASSLLLDFPVTDMPPEMAVHVGAYVDYVRSQNAQTGGVMRVEKKVGLFYLPERNGIVDTMIMHPDGVKIIDLKYGMGVGVDAVYNPQLAIYAESILRQWEAVSDIADDFSVQLTIFQPRDRSNPEPVRTWMLTRKELRDYTRTLSDKAEIILAGRGEFVPTDSACKFCTAKGICAAYASQGLVALPEQARVIDLPSSDTLTREQRIRVLLLKRKLVDWMEALEDQEKADLTKGEPSMGFKLVEGKSNRTWDNPAKAMQLLSVHLTMEQIRPPSDIVSPAGAERALKGITLSSKFKNRFEDLIVRPEGKPTLVLESDNRPSLNTKLDQLEKL